MDLSDFLQTRAPSAEDVARWPAGRRLRVRCHADAEIPPLQWIGSVRAVVFRGGALMACRLEDEIHIVPGGRREPGEAPEETLRREVLEETGWTLADPRPLGFMHFHELSPEPCPDFLQLVYMANAGERRPDAILRELDAALDVTFHPPEEWPGLPLTVRERFFLGLAARHDIRG